MTAIPLLFREFCDDASMFPPRGAQPRAALSAYVERRNTPGSDLVGPLVVPADRYSDVAQSAARQASSESVPVAVTFPNGPVEAAGLSAKFSKSAHTEVVAVEFAHPDDLSVPEFFGALEKLDLTSGADVYVEIPRATHRVEFLAAVTGTDYRAKIRTGGPSADAWPSDRELAETILALVASGVQFKTTGGLHGAIRHTDPKVERHGFLNVLVATHRALDGATARPIAEALAEREADPVVAELRELNPDHIARLRGTFHSFGTCSVDEPLEDLLDLGLVPSAVKPR